MKLQVYCIKDVTADRAMQPFMRDNDNVAKRDFIQGCSAADSPFAQNPDDYVLYHIGEWDDHTMQYEAEEPLRIMRGTEAAKPPKIDEQKLAALQEEIENIKAGLNGKLDYDEQSVGGTT